MATPATSSRAPFVPGDILSIPLNEDLFGALRILGGSEETDFNGISARWKSLSRDMQDKLMRDLRSSFDEKSQSSAKVVLCDWFGTSQPSPTELRGFRPLYLTSTDMFEDLYEDWTRWISRSELDSLERVSNVPLTEAERMNAIEMSSSLSWTKQVAHAQFKARSRAELDFLKSATEEIIQQDAKTAWKARQSLGQEVDSLLGELVSIGYWEDFRTAKGDPHPRATELGSTLLRIGGHNLMLAVWWRIHYAKSRLSMQSLNNCWHGIGGWTA